MGTGKHRILLIDDEVSFTDLLKVNLEASGRYEVKVENRGSGALATARAFQPEIILLDLVMPDMDGGQVAAQFQADPQLKYTPLIYVTAILSRQEARIHGNRIGNTAVLTKPVSTKDVVACIEQHLGNGSDVLNPAMEPYQ